MTKQQLPKTTRYEDWILFSIGDRVSYGLEIINILSKASDGDIQIEFDRLYGGLARLLQKGLVESVANSHDKGVEINRKYYRLSRLGLLKIRSIVDVQNALLNFDVSTLNKHGK